MHVGRARYALPLFVRDNYPQLLTEGFQQAMSHIWLSGKTATDHNLLPEIEAFRRRTRLRRAIEIVKLQNRIQKHREQEEDPENSEMGDARVITEDNKEGSRFQALGLFAVSEAKSKQETLQVEEKIEKEIKRRSFNGTV